MTMAGEPIDLARSFTLIVLCAPGEQDRAHLGMAGWRGPVMYTVHEDRDCPPGTVGVYAPDIPNPWKVFA